MKIWMLGVMAAAMLAPLAPASAQRVAYNLSWTGSDGYTMVGNFSYNASAGTEVRDYEVTSLFIDVRQNGTSLGTWTLPAAQSTTFNFNFDATTGLFFTGGAVGGDNGQRWNSGGGISSGQVGFFSGSNTQGVTLTSRSAAGEIPGGSSTLLATPVVPEPAAWALLIGGFGVAGAVSRRRTRVRIAFA